MIPLVLVGTGAQKALASVVGGDDKTQKLASSVEDRVVPNDIISMC